MEMLEGLSEEKPQAGRQAAKLSKSARESRKHALGAGADPAKRGIVRLERERV